MSSNPQSLSSHGPSASDQKDGRVTCISAPGKVLVAGGYLVLDPRFEGLVLATSSRFYTCVTNITAQTLPQGTEGSQKDQDEVGENGSERRSATITVSAAQFPTSCSWSYRVVLYPASSPSANSSSSQTSAPTDQASIIRPNVPRLTLEQTNPEAGRNKFIEVTLARVLQFAWESMLPEGAIQGELGAVDEWITAGEALLDRIRGEGEGLEAFVLADNDFYSQRETLSDLNLPPNLSSLEQLRPFSPLLRHISETNKTGLGSSAALVTSLTSALLSHLDLVSLDPTTPAALDTIHALAQLAHCQAQGKIGSGFDVSSAVYGSHEYKRFRPSCLAPMMKDPHLPIYPFALTTTENADGETTTNPSLRELLARDKWDHSAKPFRLPRGLRLILADVDAGTDTPSFVSKVLAYGKERNEEAEETFQTLRRANLAVRDALGRIMEMEDDEGYDEALHQLGAYPVSHTRTQGPIGEAIGELSDCLNTVRHYMRILGKAASVPIEPEEQTRLLDGCSQLPGIIGGGVPGAGGYDALFLILIDHPEALGPLQNTWARWDEMKVGPLLARQSDGGLEAHDVGLVKGLEEAVSGFVWKRTGIRGGKKATS